MKIRITEPGFKGYTGQMGVTFFNGGVSTDDVSFNDAIRMSAVMKCEWEDGTSISVAQRILDAAHTPAPMLKPSVRADEVAAETVAVEEVGEVAEVAAEEAAAKDAVFLYREDELAAIADEKGIAGLRDIGAKHGIKGNSIRGLIDALVKVTAQVE